MYLSAPLHPACNISLAFREDKELFNNRHALLYIVLQLTFI
jgi:hypothetical protein